MQPDKLPDPEVIQSAWRKAVRQLTEAPAGSPESDRLAARVYDLATDYRAAVEARVKLDRMSRREVPTEGA
jgi:hypothetical protein